MRAILYSCVLAIAASGSPLGDRATRANKDDTSAIRQAFHDANIVPDIISTFDPTLLLDVTFTNPDLQDPTVIVQPGQEVTKDQTRYLPSFAVRDYTEEDAQKPYVVIAIDPDAITPNLPVFSQVVHLLGGNYSVDGDAGEDGSLPLVNTSAPIAKWRHPIPLVGGAHRYIFLLYGQPANFTAAAIAPLADAPLILGFNVSEFARTTGLGNPVAGTYFLARPNHDDA
ncbi:phosphatidylethanolamine-binding protein [Schizophyllum commune]